MDPKGEGHGKLVRNILDAKAEMEQPGEEEGQVRRVRLRVSIDYCEGSSIR